MLTIISMFSVLVLLSSNFIFVTDWTNNALNQIALHTGQIGTFEVEGKEQVMGVFFDSKTSTVIWSVRRSPIIYSSQINGDDYKELANLGKLNILGSSKMAMLNMIITNIVIKLNRKVISSDMIYEVRVQKFSYYCLASAENVIKQLL